MTRCGTGEHIAAVTAHIEPVQASQNPKVDEEGLIRTSPLADSKLKETEAMLQGRFSAGLRGYACSHRWSYMKACKGSTK